MPETARDSESKQKTDNLHMLGACVKHVIFHVFMYIYIYIHAAPRQGPPSPPTVAQQKRRKLSPKQLRNRKIWPPSLPTRHTEKNKETRTSNTTHTLRTGLFETPQVSEVIRRSSHPHCKRARRKTAAERARSTTLSQGHTPDSIQ